VNALVQSHVHVDLYTCYIYGKIIHEIIRCGIFSNEASDRRRKDTVAYFFLPF